MRVIKTNSKAIQTVVNKAIHRIHNIYNTYHRYNRKPVTKRGEKNKEYVLRLTRIDVAPPPKFYG